MSASSAFFASIASRRFLSPALCDSASLTSFSTSFLSRPEDDVIVIFCSLPVPRSFADTFRIPFASMSNCLLYTSDAADEEDSVDLGGRRIIKKKKKKKKQQKN